MAGKVDSATHAAAFARVSEAQKFEPEFRKHIVEQALHGNPAELRERSLGVALFGRPATYDTAGDAIVRVIASDVRKRLTQHYGNSGSSPYRINLRAGSYMPEFGLLHPPAIA